MDPSRDQVLLRSLVSVHSIFQVTGGRLISLLDPPDEFRSAAESCRQIGCWPVLAGEEGQTDMMLASPIIIYDYPQIAPESSGDLFDGCEIDEILALRILTLTDEEKQEVRDWRRTRPPDPRTNRDASSGAFSKAPRSHARIARSFRGGPMNEWEWQLLEDKPSLESVRVRGVEIKLKDRVRLHPKPGADMMDLALAGKIAIVESIEQDYEGQVQIAVVIEDDPGRDLGFLRQPGHRFFFHVEEIEPA